MTGKTDKPISLWREMSRTTAARYEAALRAHGVSHRSVCWGSRRSQEARFEVLASIGDLTGKRILDVGSGLGDFHAWLRERQIDVRYTGLDVADGMVDAARARFPDVEFLHGDLVTMPDAELPPGSFDYVVASGIFAYCDLRPYDYVRETARRMLGVARHGVAFNCLSTWGAAAEPDECQFDPARMLECVASLTRRVTLRHDYLPHDFTVFLYKPEP